MDVAVGLVRAYLQVNGYFTVTEFPVVESVGTGGYRSATDIDVLACRFRFNASNDSSKTSSPTGITPSVMFARGARSRSGPAASPRAP